MWKTSVAGETMAADAATARRQFAHLVRESYINLAAVCLSGAVFPLAMNDQWIKTSSDEEASPSKARTTSVLLLLTLAALTFSYLGAFAVGGALVDSDVLPHWVPGHDPRPRWMLCLFGVLLGASMLVSMIARILSRRQLSRIDAMAEE